MYIVVIFICALAETYLGDPVLSVKIDTKDVGRCRLASKTPEKLTLNLLEFLLDSEK